MQCPFHYVSRLKDINNFNATVFVLCKNEQKKVKKKMFSVLIIKNKSVYEMGAICRG